MSPMEMVLACRKAVKAAGEIGTPPIKAGVMLVTPKGWRAPSGFPRGTLACIKPDGSSVRYFPAMRVAEWIEKLASAITKPAA